ncbi:uncharacterized protein L969DRAFT_15728 [Mixia osmundae IAM 14324]|uniref:Molybdopterin synthase sulfur carrier subunit n=1 Tax=Mixia osmundae (strain CBS 9802 / IAM 14324 / JCM 22182 / KY 12970) TaxID=764103 RepID=G7DTT5_MIXOS|nr:uncharacterized protein L969DRAFT_15728 [Mixia osmundae IAM 14324]KEI41709.1 hypothetical protein L969DRAFT_15728 [Mixia osmundae IAM 14324]GAA93995.1 hypothetical protein E5Q_00642 [Mixia osmundae IAM 14324]
MIIRLLYFASARTALGGVSSEEIELAVSTKLKELSSILLDRHAGVRQELAAVLGQSAWCVNEEIVPRDEEAQHELKPGDTVAVIPPVSGG